MDYRYRGMRLTGSVLGLLILTPFLCSADEVRLKAGRSIAGTVVEQNDREVKILVPEGYTMGIPREQVDSVEIDEVPEPTPTPTPKREPTPAGTITILKSVHADRGEEPEPAGGADKTSPPPVQDLRSVFGGGAVPAVEPAGTTVEPAGDPIGVCGRIDGDVDVQESDGSWRSLEAGETVYKGQRFRSRAGRARLLLRDGAEIGITENSEGKVRNEPGSRFQLYRGRIWSQIKGVSRADKVGLEIESPNAVAAVRGGLLRFEVFPREGSRITLFEGAATVADAGRAPAQLAPLQIAMVNTEGRIAGFEEAAEDERKEWDFWDEWAEDITNHTRHLGFGVGGQIIAGHAKQIAAEQQAYERMMDESNRQVLINREAEKLDTYADGIRRFREDVGHFPPEDKAWERLKYNLGDPGWKGPYLDSKLMLPLKDRWGNEVHYILKTSLQGVQYVELISNGPNGVFEDGKPDADIKVIVTPPRR